MNLEGPFFSRERKGAQNEEFLLAPDFELFKEWYDLSGGLVKLIDLATEQPGGEDFVKRAKELCTVSIAHTTASYEDAKDAFDWGVTHVTHLFNAMNGLHHRKPGVVGAALEDERVRAELICDGEHIHPAVLKIALNVLGDRALIVSDSLRANGMPEGAEYDLGGQTPRRHHRRVREQPAPRGKKPGKLGSAPPSRGKVRQPYPRHPDRRRQGDRQHRARKSCRPCGT